MKQILSILLCGFAISASARGLLGGHESVDLGLSVRWATTNIGARKPYQCGSYFAWGEVEPREFFDWDNYKYSNGPYGPFSKYEAREYSDHYDGLRALEPEDDAATVNWGDGWRMPTNKELEELLQCKWEWVTIKGVFGAKVSGVKEGFEDRSIFLPAAGCMDGNEPLDKGEYVRFWTSNINGISAYDCTMLETQNPEDIPLNMFSPRCIGMPIRPVCSLVTDDFNSISLGYDELVIGLAGEKHLKVITNPAHPVPSDIFKWETSDSSVVKVTEQGVIKAANVGSCIVTASIGSHKTECRIVVERIEPDAVNLGLSVLWASANVGALTPYEMGGRFSDGDTSQFEWLLERGWRLPTYTEFQELDYFTESDWKYNNRMLDSMGLDVVGGFKFSQMPGYEHDSIFVLDSDKLDDYEFSSYFPFRFTPDGTEPNAVIEEMKQYPMLPVRLVRDFSPEESAIETNIMLFKDDICIGQGERSVIYVLVQPGKIMDRKKIDWTSSDPGVATVTNGIVEAVSAGKCTVTASYGGVSESIIVTVVKPDSGQSDYKYVDLGLSVNWAQININASFEGDPGDSFAWGKPELEWRSSDSNVKHDSDSVDVASYAWGGDWRLPTTQEFQELLDSCEWTLEDTDKQHGYRVTSKVAGYTDRSIFFPFYHSDIRYGFGKYLSSDTMLRGIFGYLRVNVLEIDRNSKVRITHLPVDDEMPVRPVRATSR